VIKAVIAIVIHWIGSAAILHEGLINYLSSFWGEKGHKKTERDNGYYHADLTKPPKL
jgi:hypothetical protein